MKLSRIKAYYHLIRELPSTITRLDEQSIALKRLEKSVESKLFGNNPANDSFYLSFENRFRGSMEDIQKRQSYYIPYLTEAKQSRLKVVDIGCGRGEFLALLRDNGHHGIGIDLNKNMVALARKQGLDAVNEDANVFLKKQPDQTIGAICGFHIAEHIPFSELLVLLRSCHKALSDSGTLILETPNPESLLTSTHNFWLDPSHLNPVPPATLEFALRHIGFKDVEIHRLHPAKSSPSTAGLSDDLKVIIERYYGPRDYAVIAKK
jgi:SAM-dependent methyltransferase